MSGPIATPIRSPAKPRAFQEEASPLRVADPTLVSGLRDPAAGSVAGIASRYPGDSLLTAKAAGRVWSAGGAAQGDGGHLTCWCPTTGKVLDSAACDSCVAAIALVPTVRLAAALRSSGPTQRAGGGNGFACELLLWAGMTDGRIAVYGAADLGLPRVVLSGHRGPVTCLCAPPPPPSAPAQGCAIVLSAAPDCQLRLWDARSGEGLRAVPCDGAQIVAMIALWGGVGVGAAAGEDTPLASVRPNLVP